MKIALPVFNGFVNEHFGHSEEFVVYTISSDKKVESVSPVASMEGCGCHSGIAEILAKEFIPTFVEEDIVNLAKYQVFLKLMIDGVASLPFSAQTMRPIGSVTDSAEKIIKVSRERYAKRREVIEDKMF